MNSLERTEIKIPTAIMTTDVQTMCCEHVSCSSATLYRSLKDIYVTLYWYSIIFIQSDIHIVQFESIAECHGSEVQCFHSMVVRVE